MVNPVRPAATNATSVPQMLEDATSTRTPGPLGSSTSTTFTPSAVLRTAFTTDRPSRCSRGVPEADAHRVATGIRTAEQRHGLVDALEVEHLAGHEVGPDVAALDEL